MDRHTNKSYDALLQHEWILNLDATVKTLYGRHEEAHDGYNPMKPGRPSHVYQAILFSAANLVVNVDVRGVLIHAPPTREATTAVLILAFVVGVFQSTPPTRGATPAYNSTKTQGFMNRFREPRRSRHSTGTSEPITRRNSPDIRSLARSRTSQALPGNFRSARISHNQWTLRIVAFLRPNVFYAISPIIA